MGKETEFNIPPQAMPWTFGRSFSAKDVAIYEDGLPLEDIPLQEDEEHELGYTAPGPVSKSVYQNGAGGGGENGNG